MVMSYCRPHVIKESNSTRVSRFIDSVHVSQLLKRDVSNPHVTNELHGILNGPEATTLTDHTDRSETTLSNLHISILCIGELLLL